METIYTKIKDMLKAYYPVIYLTSFEYERTKQKIDGIISSLRSEQNNVRLYNWNCVDGLCLLQENGAKYLGEEYDEAEMALKYILSDTDSSTKDIFVLEDFSNYIEEERIKFYIRAIAERAKYRNSHVIILSAIYKLPLELETP